MSSRAVRVGAFPDSHQPRSSMGADYDVVIVGGRVAGAATAMLLARRGHRVLVVERSAMPSDTVSTHAMLRTGVLQLTRWGLIDRLIEAGTPPVRDITLGFGEDRIEFQVRSDFGVGALYAPRRYLLDAILADAAQEAGAEFVDNTTMTDLLRDGDGRVGGIEIGRGDTVQTITSLYVIGADGYRSRVAELTGAAIRQSHDPMNAIHYAYYDGIDASGFWFQFTPGVNAGLIATNNDHVLVFTGRPHELRSRFSKNPDAEFMRLLEEAGEDLADRVRSGQRRSRFYGTNGLPGFVRQAWGPGWALVGDAGYTKDPISAHGISDALRDAELCARAVDRALTDPGDAASAMTWYEDLRDSLSLSIYQQSEALAGFDWSAEEASARMRVISDDVRAECETLLALPDWSVRLEVAS